MKKTIFNLSKYCNNCGKHGHTQHECVLPIISIGIVLFRVVNGSVEYLMIRRKETFGYCDYVKNRSKNYNKTFLKNVIDEMTLKEKEYIRGKFHDNMTQELIQNSNTEWNEPEWGFPKGRRNNGEKDLDCGLREFHEETGFALSDIHLIENISPYEELFIGSNLKSYKQKYYLAYTNNDDNEVLRNFQRSEVSKMEWYTVEECNSVIRPYNYEKLRLINSIHKTISLYKCANFSNRK